MLAYLGIISLITGIVFGAVHPALFASAYSLSTALIIVGVAIIALYVILFLIATTAAVSATKSTRRRRGF